MDGQEVIDTVRLISQFHRARGSDEYKLLLERLKELLLSWGIEERQIETIEYPTGGVRYGNFDSTMVWNVRDAELWLERPRTFLNSFKNCKTSVLFGSHSTYGWKTLELVDETYTGDFKDKAVLVQMNPSKAFKQFVEERGAKCLLVYFMRAQDASIGRTPSQMPDTVNYLSLPHTLKASQHNSFGFSLTYRQYEFLKNLANKNFRVRLFVDASLNVSTVQVLRVRFEGAMKKRVGIVAHLCHPSPGANDNGSGSALALHLCRELRQKTLGFSVDVILLPEFYGSLPYASGYNDYEFVINLDMVGEDQQKTGSTMMLHETPPLLNTIYDELLYDSMMVFAPTSSDSFSRRFYRSTFKSGSDHSVFENYAVPSPFLGQWPDRYYHTSEDTPDKCDPVMFEWVGKAVLRTIELAHAVPDYIVEQALGRMRSFLKKITAKPGSDIIENVVKRAHGERIEPVKPRTHIVPSEEGPLGYEWFDKAGELSEKREIVNLGEVIQLAARYTQDYDATVTFASTYLNVDAKTTQDVIDLLLKNEFLKRVS
jgi:aminopeptidase YwaD